MLFTLIASWKINSKHMPETTTGAGAVWHTGTAEFEFFFSISPCYYHCKNNLSQIFCCCNSKIAHPPLLFNMPTVEMLLPNWTAMTANGNLGTQRMGCSKGTLSRVKCSVKRPFISVVSSFEGTARSAMQNMDIIPTIIDKLSLNGKFSCSNAESIFLHFKVVSQWAAKAGERVQM